jgi:hypothetical protein
MSLYDQIDLEKAEHDGYWDGIKDGFLFGFPIGTIGTILIILVTRHTWLHLVQ